MHTEYNILYLIPDVFWDKHAVQLVLSDLKHLDITVVRRWVDEAARRAQNGQRVLVRGQRMNAAA